MQLKLERHRQHLAMMTMLKLPVQRVKAIIPWCHSVAAAFATVALVVVVVPKRLGHTSCDAALLGIDEGSRDDDFCGPQSRKKK